ncbi:MAG: hypothetical protein NWF07_16770 [Candidatus Bathyarchaeota archaeon]|nr:hypothetical protein [Candidatus Bathyarchaeota archaeon]
MTIAAGEEGPWSFDMTVMPHPYYFAYWSGTKAYNPESARTAEGNFWNTQLVSGAGEPTNAALYTAWTDLASRWRLAYSGVTVYQDGPDLANQGTIVVAQAPLTPRIFIFSNFVANTSVVSAVRAAFYEEATQGPSFSRSQTMPNAMMGRSRDGAYVPLKLTETGQDWFSTEQDISVLSAVTNHTGTASCKLPFNSLPSFPFPCATPLYETAQSPGSAVLGDVVSGLIGSNCAHISARNLSDQTSYTFYFRFGIELQLSANSSMTPQLKLSPPYDRQALDTYFMLSREMKDAYPADYNDLGKMWDVISGAAKTLAPALNLVFPGLGNATTTVASLGDAIRKKRQDQRVKDMKAYEVMPAATQERVQAQKVAASVQPPVRYSRQFSRNPTRIGPPQPRGRGGYRTQNRYAAR